MLEYDTFLNAIHFATFFKETISQKSLSFQFWDSSYSIDSKVSVYVSYH